MLYSMNEPNAITSFARAFFRPAMCGRICTDGHTYLIAPAAEPFKKAPQSREIAPILHALTIVREWITDR
jgi:hypothetical protein